MDLKRKPCSEIWSSSSIEDEPSKMYSLDHQTITAFSLTQSPRKWEDSSNLDYRIEIEQPFSRFDQSSEPSCSRAANSGEQINIPDQVDSPTKEPLVRDWNPRAMLSNLSFLEQKINQLKDLVHLIVDQEDCITGRSDELLAQQQQLVSADLTSIIVQLISTAGSLLPSVKSTFSAENPFVSQLGSTNAIGCSPGVVKDKLEQENVDRKRSIRSKIERNVAGKAKPYVSTIKENEPKDEDDVGDGENLSPDSYEVLQLEKEEILAPHTHFCLICGKGFKRDANLRMHMRGHGDEYKTPAALAKPMKESPVEPILLKRYSCPYLGCKRNKDHKKFQPLKTILCVKNHYKRTHCDKSYTCSRCNSKKFSVIADLKTHEKHCGRDKWLCSCGTTFSRKDKLFGHVTLFQGHTPALSFDEAKGFSGASDGGESNDVSNEVGSVGFIFSSSTSAKSATQDIVDSKTGLDDPTSFYSPMNFESCNFGGFNEFPKPPFEIPESSLSFLLNGSCNYIPKNGV